MTHYSASVLQHHIFKRDTKQGRELLLAALILAALAGCHSNNAAPPASTPLAPKSAVQVNASPDGVTVHTPTAEFLLTPAGALQATLHKNDAAFTLDVKANDASQVVTIAGKDYTGVVLNTATATVRDATGKLGNLGIQIELNGKIPGTNLDETLTLEVYDAFPNLALLSLSLHNTGQNDISLDKVVLQQHTFAPPQPTADATRPLWTFDGASLDWGKDEIISVSR